MRRALFVTMLAVLTLSMSGLSGVVFDEPCSLSSQETLGDSACSPTCVTCGCCAQAVEAVAIAAPGVPQPLVSDVSRRSLHLPPSDPRDVLHVPKPIHV